MFEGSFRSNLLLATPAVVLSALLVAATGALSPDFLTAGNLANLASRLPPLGLAALGEALTLVAGRIDLAVGSIISLATATMALTSDRIGWLAAPLTLALGVLCGCFTATGVVVLRINPLVMSLATAAIVKGAALLLLPSPGGEVDYAFYSFLFEPERVFGPPLLFSLAIYLVFIVIMGWTRFGRGFYAFGSDPRAAVANGAIAWKADFAAYGLSGLFAALAGIFLSVRILSGDPLIGESYTLDAVAAAILGGVALRGGRGSLVGVFFAALALVLINNSFNLLNLDTNLQVIAKGLVFVLALVFFMRGKAAEA